ncbi:MAG: BTAD domain-containing putative transcriptional regulator [Paracoccaceae bacterium]
MEIRAFGATSVSVPPGGASLPLGMKALGLCAFLVDQAPRPATRDALVELFWERVGPTQGKGSLRQEIRRIKKSLGAAVFDSAFSVSDTHVGIYQGAVLYDGEQISLAADAKDPETLASLLTLHTGEFLVDNAARAESFQDWARGRRVHFNERVIAALVRLSDSDIAATMVERAQRSAERIIAIDPLHEKGHELLIRCHIASGRRAEARAHFERFRATMLQEFGAEPMREIADLVAPGAPAGTPGAAAGPAKPAIAPTAKAGGARPTIAVLNVTKHLPPDRAYLADGVAEQLVASLSKSTWIRVAALSSAPFAPGGDAIDRGQRDLRDYADYILRVDVRAHRQRVAILSTLSRVADGETIFSAESEDESDDILSLQRNVARRIASIFEPMIIDDQAKREAAEEWREPDDVNHWRLLMRARWLFWTTRPSNNKEAQRLLQKALKISPLDVPTYCILGFSHMLDAWSDWTDDVAGSVREAQRWAGRAVQIAPNDGWAQLTLGVACSTPDTLDQAKSRVAHALRLSPSLVVAVGEMARFHAFDGETAEATRLADEALALSPYDVHAGLWLRSKAFARWIDGDLSAALELIDFALIIRPGWFQNHYLRAAILIEQGKDAPAKGAFLRGQKLMGAYSDAALRIGHPFRDRALHQRFVQALNKAGGSFAL